MNPLFGAYVALNVVVYRATGGRLMGRFRGAPICLLTTRGRKTGQSRTAPLLYLKDGGNMVVVASSGGASQHPAWFFNLEAHPRAEVQTGGTHQTMTARQASEEEKSRLWPQLVKMYPPYAEYQKRTSRAIPLIILSPAAAA